MIDHPKIHVYEILWDYPCHEYSNHNSKLTVKKTKKKKIKKDKKSKRKNNTKKSKTKK